ncbi:helix-turn-helix domain-containing protein [Nocardiopsis synnemataformans]|uniref:helix-turn-helix domain-containing protein n=1 Tax=Nocardiopsis synnemataformans TaxID=61305 RepID=UPI003EC0CF3E
MTELRRDWHRVAEAVSARRAKKGLRQQDVAARGGPSPALQYQIENAKKDGPLPYQAEKLRALDNALDWPLGTILRIADGHEIPVDHEPAEVIDHGAPSDPIETRIGKQLSDALKQLSDERGEDAAREVMQGFLGFVERLVDQDASNDNGDRKSELSLLGDFEPHENTEKGNSTRQ